MRKYVYPVLPSLIALALRIYPTLLSGLPFSLDAWSPIRNAELLLEHTPISLDNQMLDGYNNYWPANSLFAAVLSQVTGLAPIKATAIGVPLAGAFTILIFYALVSRVSRNPKLAFIASIVLATAYPHTMLTAGVTKETYANPLYMSAILMFLCTRGWIGVIPFALLSVALALAHHLTAFVTVTILAIMTITLSMERIARGLDPDKLRITLASIMAMITAAYFYFYSYRGFIFALDYSDWISVASYQLLTLTATLYLVSNARTQERGFWRYVLAVAALIFFLLSMRTPLVPNAPVLPASYLIYSIPLLVLLPLAVRGYGMLLKTKEDSHGVVLSWFAVTLGLELYALLGGSFMGLTLLYRGINFLWPPLIIAIAFGAHELYLKTEVKRPMLRLLLILAVFAIVVSGCYDLYAATSLEERHMGYYWFYRAQEYDAGVWIDQARIGYTMAGDTKVGYFLKGYFGLNVDVIGGYRYLSGRGPPPDLLFVYGQMFKNGYVLDRPIDLPPGWMERIRGLSLIYSNGFVELYRG